MVNVVTALSTHSHILIWPTHYFKKDIFIFLFIKCVAKYLGVSLPGPRLVGWMSTSIISKLKKCNKTLINN